METCGEYGIVLVRIIKVPAGEASESIRCQWVGIMVPAADHGNDGCERGLISRDRTPARRHFIVPSEQAVGALRQAGRHEAAVYFSELAGRAPFFSFGADELEILGGEPCAATRVAAFLLIPLDFESIIFSHAGIRSHQNPGGEGS